MAKITLRNSLTGATGPTNTTAKGSPLTNAEIDQNFINLNTELEQKIVTGRPWAASTSVTVGQVLYVSTHGNAVPVVNRYIVTVAGTTSSTAPSHTTGTATNGTATLLYVASLSFTAADILTLIKYVDGSGSGLDADLLDGLNAVSGATGASIVSRDSSGNFSANSITADLVGDVTGDISGNAGTVTNGVYSNVSYNNPTWIVGLAGSKVTSIPNTSLSNSSVTINGQTVALGGSTSILGLDQTWTGAQTFRDNKFIITDGTDNSKVLNLELSNITTNTVRTLIIPNENGTFSTRAYTDALPTRDNTFTGAQIFKDNKFTIVDDSDDTKKLNLQLSGITTNTTRTLTVPDKNGIIALIDSPTFTGTPAAPTPTTGDNTTNIATTAFVNSSIEAAKPYFFNSGMVVQTAVAYCGPARQLIVNNTPQAVTGLSISFTPKYSNSIIILTAQLSTNAVHVASFGFYKNGSPTVSTAGQNNANEPNMQTTTYIGTGSNDMMLSVPIMHYEVSGNTTARTYQVYATSAWAVANANNTSGAYALYINNRNSNDMASFSYMTIMEVKV